MVVKGMETMAGKIAKCISAFLMIAAAALSSETLAQGSSRTVRIAAVNSEGGKFYPNSAESGDDFEVFYQNLKVLSVSEVKSKSREGLFMFVR